MIIFVYNPFKRSKQVFQGVERVEERLDKSFRVYKKDGFYKDFPRLCLWWEIKDAINPGNPCEDCVFSNPILHTCENPDEFTFNLSNNKAICAMHHSK